MRLFLKTFFICAIGISAAQTFATPIPVVSVKHDSDGITLQMNPGVMRLEVYSARTVRVTYAAQDKLPDLTSFAVIGKPERAKWHLSETGNEITLRTDEIQARVNRATGAVSFLTNRARPFSRKIPTAGNR